MGQRLQRYSISPRTAIVSGQRTFATLVNAVRTHSIVARFRANVTVAGGITAVRNRGSVLALFNRVGLVENGEETISLDARLWRFVSEMHAPNGLSADRMLIANGTYDLDETIVIPFAHPLAARPTETAYVERDPRQPLELFADYNGNVARLGAVGAGSITINSVSLQLMQVADDKRADPPLLRPYIREITFPVNSVGTAIPLYLRTSRYIRAIAFQQDSDAGEVPDVMTALALRGDVRTLIGPQAIPTEQLVLASELEFGGNVSSGGGLGSPPTPRYGYLGFNYQRHGLLTQVINPADDVNFRAEVNQSPSAVTGATNSFIRVGMLELESVAGLTADPASWGFTI